MKTNNRIERLIERITKEESVDQIKVKYAEKSYEEEMSSTIQDEAHEYFVKMRDRFNISDQEMDFHENLYQNAKKQKGVYCLALINRLNYVLKIVEDRDKNK